MTKTPQPLVQVPDLLPNLSLAAMSFREKNPSFPQKQDSKSPPAGIAEEPSF